MKKIIGKVLSIAVILSILSTSSLTNFIVGQTYAAGLLSTASIQLGDPRPSQSGVTYTALFTPSGTAGIQCMNIVFNTMPDMSGGVPAVLLSTSAVKGTISGGGLTDGNWTLYNTNNGTLQYESASARTTSATAVTIPTTTITNTSAATFYAQITTYSSLSTHTCSTIVDQSNVIALTTLGGYTTTVTVQPTLSFSVADYGSPVNGSGDSNPKTTTVSTIPFGTVAAGATSWGSQTLTVSTNGSHGYTLYTRYSNQMIDPNSDTIRDQATGTPTSGAAFDGSSSQSSLAFTADGNGYNFGGTDKWAGLSTTNNAIAARAAAINSDVTHIELKVQISNTQPPGLYSTVIAYTATPSY
jgi:hypothetical protein